MAVLQQANEATPALAAGPTPAPFVAMDPPAFKTPQRQGPATANGVAPKAVAVGNGESPGLRRNLWHAKDVNGLVSQLESSNQFKSIEETGRSLEALPGVLSNHMTVFAAAKLAGLGLGPDMSLHVAGPSVVMPTRYYQFAHYVGSLAKENGVGNCGDKASLAAVMMADRGLGPVEIFCLSAGDHGFCVVGRAPGSDLHDPKTWGPDAVIVDPWSNETYPATEAGPGHMRGLIPAGSEARFDRQMLIAGTDPNP